MILNLSAASRVTAGRSASGKGFGMPLGEGSIEWDKVRAELNKINYHGWAIAEVPGGDQKRLEDIAHQMDRVLDLI